MAALPYQLWGREWQTTNAALPRSLFPNHFPQPMLFAPLSPGFHSHSTKRFALRVPVGFLVSVGAAISEAIC